MSKYSIAKAYSGIQTIKAADLLTAVKISMNHEADLYEDGKLVCSWLGLPMEQNIEQLHERGISTYIHKNQYCFKWLDESKNDSKVYAHIIPYTWDGKPQLQVNVHDYCSGDYEKEFDSLESLCAYLQEEYAHLSEDVVSINIFGDEYKRYSLADLTLVSMLSTE